MAGTWLPWSRRSEHATRRSCGGCRLLARTTRSNRYDEKNEEKIRTDLQASIHGRRPSKPHTAAVVCLSFSHYGELDPAGGVAGAGAAVSAGDAAGAGA